MIGKHNITKELIKICKDKDILFIENDPSGLHNSVGNFADFCIDNKLKYYTILDAENIPLESIINQIESHEVIVWESTYLSDVSSKLLNLIDSKMFHKKILIECYIHDPFCWYKPDTHHKVLILNSFDNDVKEWELYELKEDKKPIWDKKDNEL